jgi:phenylpropionate dioxygenase-like ring-hydroxylating dioxygenase large terminal subunit
MNDPVLENDWHPLVRSEDLIEGQVMAARLLEQDLVLWRLDGRALAWQDLCVHRGTRLSLGKVENHALVCPYHGWTYDANGQCIRFPAHPEQVPPLKAHARVFHARECYGLVWVSLGEPFMDLPSFPEEDDSDYRKILSGPFGPIQAGAPRVIENFLDVAHLPFVHQGTLGDHNHAVIEDYQAEIRPDGIHAENIRIYQPDPYGTGQGDVVTYTYRVLRPLTAYLAKETKNGIRFSIMFPITPIDKVKSIAWFYMALQHSQNQTDQEVSDFHASILAQDTPIVESQRPELLPLDLQSELHLRSDRTAIAYRRWLNEQGVTFGTA